MRHQGTKRIETKRLILRRFQENDAESMFRNWTNSFEVTKYLTWKPHENNTETEVLLDKWIKESEKDDFYQWAIELKEIHEPIGTISVVGKDENIDMVEIGYCIGLKWWNHGIMSEAFRAVISFFFEEVGVNRIQAQHDSNNPNSGRVMKKCGLKYEGTLRQAGRNNQGIVDMNVYGLLREEWSNILCEKSAHGLISKQFAMR